MSHRRRRQGPGGAGSKAARRTVGAQGHLQQPIDRGLFMVPLIECSLSHPPHPTPPHPPVAALTSSSAGRRPRGRGTSSANGPAVSPQRRAGRGDGQAVQASCQDGGCRPVRVRLGLVRAHVLPALRQDRQGVAAFLLNRSAVGEICQAEALLFFEHIPDIRVSL